QPAPRPSVDRWPIQRPFDWTSRSVVMTGAPPSHGLTVNIPSPPATGWPPRSSWTLTGTVREPLTTMPADAPTGASQIAWASGTWAANESDELLPESSTAVQFTVVSPTGMIEPDAGEHDTDGDASTMSLAVGGA